MGFLDGFALQEFGGHGGDGDGGLAAEGLEGGTVDDFLARRTRALVLNARAAREAAPKVAELLARELGRDEQWKTAQVEQFSKIAENYVLE